MKLVFIRHGDPDYVNDTVTERGACEARALRARLACLKIDEILCSPLGRARDTASIALEGSGRHVDKVCDWLQEFYYPINDPVTGKRRIAWDLMPDYWTSIPQMFDKDGWQNCELYSTGAIAEECARVKAGIDEVLARYGYRRDGRFYRTEAGSEATAVFFCHLGVQFVVLSYLLNLSAPALWHGFFVAPTSVTTLCTEERQKGIASFRCKGLGDVSHLYAGGLTPSDSGFFTEVFREGK